MSKYSPIIKTSRVTKTKRDDSFAELIRTAKIYDRIEKIKQQRRKREMKEKEEEGKEVLKCNQTAIEYNDALTGLAMLYLIVCVLLIFYISAIIFKIFAIVILIGLMYLVIKYTYLGVKYIIKITRTFINRNKVASAK